MASTEGEFLMDFEEAVRSHPLSVPLKQVIKEILKIRDELWGDSDGRDFTDYSIQELSNYQMKLSILNITLGEFASKHDLIADYAYAYRKRSYMAKWEPTKARLRTKIERTTNPDIEAEVNRLVAEDVDREVVKKAQAQRLKLLLDNVDTLLFTLSKRIKVVDSQNMTSHIQT